MAKFKHVKYPREIIEDVKSYKETNDGSIFDDADVEALSRDEVFKCVVEWDGLIGYLSKIKSWIRDIYGIDLNRPEESGEDGIRREFTLCSRKTNRCISRVFYSEAEVNEYLESLSSKANWKIVSRNVIYKGWSEHEK